MNNPETSGGNWAWLTAIITGALAGAHAWFRRRRSRIPPEVYDRLEELRSWNGDRVRAENRIMVQVRELREDLDEIRNQTATRREVEEMERRLMRAILDSRT